MYIRDACCIDGAKNAIGLGVLIDVFRASSTITTMFGKGVESIIAVGGLEQAHELKERYPDYLLVGERGGEKINGFDYGNSPTYFSKMDLKGKKAILTTSSGTQGIVNAKRIDELVVGCFLNANAVVDYIRKQDPKNVTLMAIGFGGTEAADEDQYCAQYLTGLLIGDEDLDFQDIKAAILKSKGAKRLRDSSQEDDLEFSLRLDTYNVVPKINEHDGLFIIGR